MADNIENTDRTIRDRLRTTFMGLAGLLSKMNVMQGSNPAASNTAILNAVENIDIDTSELAKQGSDDEVSLTGVDNKLDTLLYYFDDVTYQNVMDELNSSDDE